MGEVVLWTVGHSNHDLDRFFDLLRGADIRAVADVRSDPDRVYRDHFKPAPLRVALAEVGIKYVFLGAELGGRPRTPTHFDDAGRARYDLMAAEPAFRRGWRGSVTGRSDSLSPSCALRPTHLSAIAGCWSGGR